MADEQEPRARGFYWVRFVGQSESEVALWNGRWWYQNGVDVPAADAEVEAVIAGPLEVAVQSRTKKDDAVIDRARELIAASDGRSLYLVPGGRIDVDVNLYAALSRAVVELRTERGEPRFAEKSPGIVEYQKVVSAWMAARAAAFDQLTQEQESEWTAKVADIWSRLSKVEQEQIELMETAEGRR
jgi:hypothetical protein